MKEHYWTLYIGGCEWRITETGKPSWVKKYLQCGSKDKKINGRCFVDRKLIFIRKGQHQQDRYETLVHEAIHAISTENRQNGTMVSLLDDEEATHILAKGICSILRQMRDFGVTGRE